MRRSSTGGRSRPAPPKEGARETGTVLIVSKNVDTIDGLQAYLAVAEIGTTSAQAVDEFVRRLACGSPFTSVFFPDDFVADQVDAAVDALRSASAGFSSVVVTRAPQRFDGRFARGEARIVVLAKPAWGWTIRDAILGRVEPGAAGGGADAT